MSFSIEFDGLKEAVAFLRSAPRKTNRAMAFFVSEQARITKHEHLPTVIRKGMIVRNSQFVKSSFIYRRSPLGGRSPHIATASTHPRERFTQWAEQERGTKAVRKYGPTKKARGGNLKNKMRVKARFKPGNLVTTMSREKTKSGKKEVLQYLKKLQRRNYKGLFMIPSGKHPKFPGGAYIFSGRRNAKNQRGITMMQGKNPRQPKRYPISKWAVRLWKSRINVNREWKKAMKFVYQ